jgi:BirA family biotin operon repressor/biotin-[acetyl-CoA-carboxylase] ligase
LTKQTVQIKWPNDVLLHERKVCGILVEYITGENVSDHLIVGVGINLRKWETDSKFADKMTSLEEHQITIEDSWESLSEKDDPSLENLTTSTFLQLILQNMEENYEQFLSDAEHGLGKLKEAYEQFLINKNHQVRVMEKNGSYAGISRGINEQGELLVKDRKGRLHNLNAGEVSVRGLDGYI